METATVEKALEKILDGDMFFRGMKAEHLHSIVDSGTIVRFEEGEVIFDEGEPAHRCYVIRTGRVALQLVSYRVEPLTLVTLEPGSLIGWSWLFPPYRWKFTAKALEVTRAISLDGDRLRAKCDQDHELGYELMKRFAAVIDKRIEALSTHLVEVEH